MPAEHIHTDPTIPAPAPEGEWLRISAAMTAEIATISGCKDLVVTCAPGAGRGAPGVHIPSLAAIEIDAAILPAGMDPTTVEGTATDARRYPALWGVLTHEGAHAAHTHWDSPTTMSSRAGRAAMLLEEARIEAAHTGRRPTHRRWLRASAKTLILPTFLPDPDDEAAGGALPPVPAPPASTPVPPAPTPAPPVPMTRAAAARAAALLLARADAGILGPTETAPVETVCAAILGADDLAALRRIWQAATATADDDTATMLRLGEQWADLVGDDEEETDRVLAGAGTGTGPALDGATPLGEAIAEALDAITADTHGHSLDGETRTAGTRPATRVERTAAGTLARALRRAAVPERVPVTVTSATPPGRLRMRGALAADAQRAAGALPTARPFTRTRHKKIPNPPLRLGIAVDVSGSMRTFAKPAASTAWITATAAAAVPGTHTQTVIFGRHVRALSHPGAAPQKVTKFEANDGTEVFTEAVDLLTASLGLDRPGGAIRLLVVISDGKFLTTEKEQGEARLRRLASSGCHLLWITPSKTNSPIPPAPGITLDTPTTTATAIADAALRALRPS
ncbi:VWA domain containing CoxE-like protein [Parafrankia irregularis]|uniref:VWA domain containing CoxE-like protein n=1 Tax=Parafrankia irregularis TaxID=795642 RepID=A0A0S4QZD3_9ACTN|nr:MULTISPECIES: VWA domain-containing protein [Frankiaceae]KPM50316.1 VWA containing CoxE family protein [Frankia sp. R43]MBE3204703.1 VWA domain-containing protein [Parafrankia sp. CH37]CUU60893.1 VWA domain containing CoxE-like protein [Parafrankia irregularis]